ncbi:hypothetical protein FDO65_10175 [Nakamurella flava]|uniref:Uncharacterized protein n=1 Tax=Nakamurella flava TaxID=2576308 RepID=A0A4U6QN58_9ACTN|nr:hypothetical protein [Nakamurella flava]TKV61881.1 hypothetical protein FDO65_10175 [Nakamurella flava]
MADQEYDKALGDLRTEFAKLKEDIVSGVLDKKVGPREVPFWLYASDTKTTLENVEQKLIRVEANQAEILAKLDTLLGAKA